MGEERGDRLARVEFAEDVGHLADAIRDRAAARTERRVEFRERLEVERKMRRIRVGRQPHLGLEYGERDQGRAVKRAFRRRMRERRMVVEPEIALEPNDVHADGSPVATLPMRGAFRCPS